MEKMLIPMVTIGTADLDRAVRFHTEITGMECPEGIQTYGGTRLAMFGKAPHILGMMENTVLAADAQTTPSPVDLQRFPNFVFTIYQDSREAVDEVLRRAKEHGALVPHPAKENQWGIYGGYMIDFDGFYWEVAHFSGPPPDADSAPASTEAA